MKKQINKLLLEWGNCNNCNCSYVVMCRVLCRSFSRGEVGVEETGEEEGNSVKVIS